jgi:hypothetical protein
VLESIILPALVQGGYSFKRQVLVGVRPAGGIHKIDVLAADSHGRLYLLSMKWQQVGGTAEQKVPFELICLIDLMRKEPDKYHAAYIVLGGTGWKMRDFYISGALNQFIPDAGLVRIVGLEQFVALANKGQL